MYESALQSFYLVTVWFYNFWRKIIGAKADHKMLMKLNTKGVNFINIFRFYGADSYSYAIGKAYVKAACKMLMKSTPGVNFTNMLTCSFYARKYSDSQLLFDQQYYAQLYTQLEDIHNFYTVHSILSANKISVNLMAQKLLIKC